MLSDGASRTGWTSAVDAALAIPAALSAYAVLTAQDALIKTTVGTVAPTEALCLRSVVTLGICIAFAGPRLFVQAFDSSCRALLVVRALLGVAAWSCFFEANKSLPFSEATAIVLCAPLILAVIAPLVSQERTTLRAWVAVGVGLAGVLFTTLPGQIVDARGSGLAVAAACLWAATLLLARRIATKETGPVQVVYVNAAFILTGVASPSAWSWPDGLCTSAILVAGLLGCVGQLTLVYALKHTTALIVAMLQYTTLVWALIFGCILAGEQPTRTQLVGALLVAASGGMLTWLRREHDVSAPEIAREAGRRTGPTSLAIARVRETTLPCASRTQPTSL